MPRLSEQKLAQISIGVLLLVIVRSLGEYFRLQYAHGDTLVVGQVTPYVAGALFAAIALTIACYFTNLYRVSIVIAAATLVLLFVYKVAIVG
jgi:hypothetical protein